MRVCVEESIFEYLPHIGIEQARRNLGAVDTGLVDLLVIGDFDGIDILQGEHFFGGVGPDHLWDSHAWYVSEVLPKC